MLPGSRRALLVLVSAVIWRNAVSQIVPVVAPVQACATSNQADAYCGRVWGITNAVTVIDHWEVKEVRFFWDSRCQLPLATSPTDGANFLESSVLRTVPDSTADKAFDEDITTSWSSECNYLTGGCAPRSQWIVAIQASNLAFKNPNDAYANVRCMQIYQSPHIMRQAPEIDVFLWVRSPPQNSTDWVINDAVPSTNLVGSSWQTRPLQPGGMVRLWNTARTSRPWQVAEVRFFSDRFCEKEVTGVPVNSGTFLLPNCEEDGLCDEYLPWKAFDGLTRNGQRLPEPLPTRWIANCPQLTGCDPEAAWIGADFGLNPIHIQCVQIYQPVYELYPEFGYPHYTSGVRLDYWDGVEWIDSGTFTGLSHGGWNETLPPAGSAWRLSNFDSLPDAWKVHEVKFYTTPNCGLSAPGYDALPVTASGSNPYISSNPALEVELQDAACRADRGSCPDLAFDDNTHTAWEASCAPCSQREAWIGMALREISFNITCFRIFQSSDWRQRSDAMELSMWNGNYWDAVSYGRFETGVGGGTWNARPAAPLSAWRFQSTSETLEPWTVQSLKFYSDSYCTNPIQAEVITSGGTVLNPAEDAFDDSTITEWVSSCPPPTQGLSGCSASSSWLGLQDLNGIMSVQCVRIQQDRDRRKQVSGAILQEWDGMRWVLTPHIAPFEELGGGSFQTLPGARGSMWRLLAQPVMGGYGVGVSELQMHRTSTCSGEPVRAAHPNVVPVSSGYATAREVRLATGYGFHLIRMKDQDTTNASEAFDGNLASFWAQLYGSGSSTWRPMWVGLDLTTQVTDVLCVRLAMVGVRSLQASTAEIQAWDGSNWVTHAAATLQQATMFIPVPHLAGGGWQRRPCPARSMWRLENAGSVLIQTWEVMEVELYDNIGCSGLALHRKPGRPFGTAIGSAVDAPSSQAEVDGGHMAPQLAFDGDVYTYWAAQCDSPGCTPGEAWIGHDFGEPVEVQCMRMVQSGQLSGQAREVALATWNGNEWETRVQYSGLGGGSWSMRPAGPDTLWRVVYVRRQDDICVDDTRVPRRRAWGVVELDFYGDDDCTELVPRANAEPIASGSLPQNQNVRSSQSYNPGMAFDGLESSLWAAECVSSRNDGEADCTPGEEWIGLDFNQATGGLPVQVKCVGIIQSKRSGDCCDPAEELRLERWNGTDWVPAVWRHLPWNWREKPESEWSQPPFRIEGQFNSLARCSVAITSGLLRSGSGDNLPKETRSRRQSETCSVPLSQAVLLLSDSYCMKHSACDAAGFTGECCPMGSANANCRCCCTFLQNSKVFVDELGLSYMDEHLNTSPVIGVELLVIRATLVLPIMGLIAALGFWIVVSIEKPSEDAWSWRQKAWRMLCQPIRRWIESGSLLATVLLFLTKRTEHEKRSVRLIKRVTLLVSGFLLGGFLVWFILGVVLAEILLRLLMLLVFVIRVAKAPYTPGDPAGERQRRIVLGMPFEAAEADVLSVPNITKLIAATAQSLLQTAVLFVRCLFDIVLLRFSFMRIGAIDVVVTVPEIFAFLPNFNLDTRAFTDFIYEVLVFTERIFESFFRFIFNGVPRCEGPVLFFSGMWLIVITLVLVRWLNYDYFGLLFAAKESVAESRPKFQKAIATGIFYLFQAVVFMFLQAFMLLFSRTLMLVSFSPEIKEGLWSCPYNGGETSTIIGRVFLILMALLASMVIFLCANGHLMGKKAITREMGRKLDMDLSGLDDSVEDDGSFLRVRGVMSMIPTTLGLWIDGWNVKDYLIKERAVVYAKQMKFPVVCPHCGEEHVPYTEVMKATGMQISLAFQVLPFGAIPGKACEYLNNPPFYYWGTELACFNARENVALARAGRQRKMDSLQYAGYMTTLSVAYLVDEGVPWLARLASLAMYIALVYFTFCITAENLAKMSRQMFTWLMALCTSKALLEFLIPAVVILLFALVLYILNQLRPSAAKAVRRRLPLIGQIFHGVMIGCTCGIYLASEEQNMQRQNATLLGTAVGLMLAYIAVSVAYIVELYPKQGLTGDLFYIFYSIGVAFCIARFATRGMTQPARVVIMALAANMLTAVSGVSFLTSAGLFAKCRAKWLPPAPIQLQGMESTVLQLLASERVLSGTFGIIAGVFASVSTHLFWRDLVGPEAGLACTYSTGLLAGLAYALATDITIETREGLWAVGSGTIVAFVLGLTVGWLWGVIAGSVVGMLVGAYMEHRMIKAVMAECYETARFTKPSKVMSTDFITKASSPRQDPKMLQNAYPELPEYPASPGRLPVHVPEDNPPLADSARGPDATALPLQDATTVVAATPPGSRGNTPPEGQEVATTNELQLQATEQTAQYWHQQQSPKRMSNRVKKYSLHQEPDKDMTLAGATTRSSTGFTPQRGSNSDRARSASTSSPAGALQEAQYARNNPTSPGSGSARARSAEQRHGSATQVASLRNLGPESSGQADE